MKKEKSIMKTFAIAGIVCSVIGLGLDFRDVYVYDSRLATSMLLLISLFFFNLDNLNE